LLLFMHSKNKDGVGIDTDTDDETDSAILFVEGMNELIVFVLFYYRRMCFRVPVVG
jgi:hypothetical protein